MKSASPQTPLVNPLSCFTFSSDSSATSTSIPSLFLFSSTLSAAVKAHTLQMQGRGLRTTGTQRHWDCIRKRHTWVSFGELKYLCQGTRSRHIPQCWPTPGKYLHCTGHPGAWATAAPCGSAALSELGTSTVPPPGTAGEWEVRKGSSSFWEQQPELSSGYGWAGRRFVPLHRGRVTVKPFKWEQGWMVNLNY